MIELHVNTADVAEQLRFWCGVLDATLTTDGAAIEGSTIVLHDRAPTGGTGGTVLDHVGIQVRDLAVTLQRLDEAKIPYDRNPNGTQAMVTAPDDFRVELSHTPVLSTTAAFHHLHFYTPDVLAMQHWYAGHLGATPGKRAHFDAADLPGLNLTFSPSDTERLPTEGRALSYVTIPQEILPIPVHQLSLTDPYGTAIRIRNFT